MLHGRGARRKVEADERARGAVRERATRAAGSRARSDAGGWVRRFGRATRVAGEQRRQVGQVCQRRGEGKASADGVCCGTGRRSRVSRPSAEKWVAGREGAGLPCPAGWAGGRKTGPVWAGLNGPDWIGCWAGHWVAVGLVFLPISILFPSKTNLFEFKQSLNSTTLCTQANKINAPA